MRNNELVQNIIDQIKEAQIKLGYVKETVRLYYPVESLNPMTGAEAKNTEEMLVFFAKHQEYTDTVLGTLTFCTYEGRIEVSIPPEGSEYVHKQVPDPAFLVDIIGLFGGHHGCTLEDIRGIFEKHSSDYCCEKMPEGMEFDYVLYFPDPSIDPYYYCIKEEMGHTIYHRFTKTDYEAVRTM